MEINGITRIETQTMEAIQSSARNLDRIAKSLEGIEAALNKLAAAAPALEAISQYLAVEDDDEAAAIEAYRRETLERRLQK